MIFGNIKYLISIAIASAAMLGLFIAYLVWKRRVLRRLLKNDSVRRRLVRGSRAAAWIKSFAILLSILFFALVMLRPQWGERAREVRNEGTDLLIALDVSRSMRARDVSPSRLDRAKDAIRLLAGSLHGDRIGLILFAGDAFLQCPLTTDMGAFTMFLDSAGPDSVRLQGTDIGKAMRAAERMFNKKRMTSKLFVLITDGEDHEGNVSGALSGLKDLGVRVYTVGVGRYAGGEIPEGEGESSEAGVLRDESGAIVRTKKDAGLLERIARETDGEYLDITDSLSDAYAILRAISRESKTDFGSRIVKERKERYQIFALLLLLLLSIEIMLPERRGSSRRLVMKRLAGWMKEVYNKYSAK